MYNYCIRATRNLHIMDQKINYTATMYLQLGNKLMHSDINRETAVYYIYKVLYRQTRRTIEVRLPHTVSYPSPASVSTTQYHSKEVK